MMRRFSLPLTAAALFLIGFGMARCANADNSETPASGSTATEGNPIGSVTTITTSADRTCNLTPATVSLTDAKAPSGAIRLQPGTIYQEMDGFGAAITGSTCYNLMRMKPAERHNFLLRTFSPTDGYGFSYCRISIGCSDFSLSEYSCCDTPGIENFALTAEETDYVIPVLKEILAINPDLKIMGSPWTPPRWMKVNNPVDKRPHDKWTSGSLNPDLYQDYAEYFVRWIKAFAGHGIRIHSVTPQNEPLNRGNSASCHMTWQEQRDFIKTALGPAIHANTPEVKIYAFDHNYNYDDVADQKGYPLHIYEDAEAAGYLAGAAYHNYGGNPEELNSVHASAPDKELVFSETSIGTWNGGRDLRSRLTDDMEEVALGTVNRWCRGVIVWNLMLDLNGAPNRPGGCQTCYGAVDISPDYSTITLNSHYYIIAHMASVVKPGAHRIGSGGSQADDLTYAAFLNPDGTYALVLCNDGKADLSIPVWDGTGTFRCNVPAQGVTSCLWRTPAE